MRKVNILLINPPIYDFAAFDLYLKPLGLLYIAAILINENYNCYLIDCLSYDAIIKHKKYGCGKFIHQEVTKPEILKHIPRKYKRYGLKKDEIIDRLNRIEKIDCVIITCCMTYWYLGVIEIIEIIRKYFKNIPIILGGIYATLCYEHAKRNCDVDYIIRGEGELKTLKLVDELTNNKSNYEKYTSVDTLPNPAFNLYKNKNYVCILTTRGCPFNCSYCASPILNPNFSKRTPEKVINEIEYYYKNGIRNFAFYDDALLYDKEHITEILQGIIKKEISAYFHTPNGLNARYLDNNIAKLLYRANFKTIRIGLETVNETRQASTGNKITTDEFIEVVDNLKQAGFNPNEIGVYVLVGLPNQPIEEVIQTVEFVYKIGAKPILTEYSPVPNTYEFEKASKNFILSPEKDPLLHNNSILPYNSKNITIEDFQKLKNKISKLNKL